MPDRLFRKLRASAVPIVWQPALPIVASDAFLSAAGDEYGWIGGSDEHGVVHCILPYTVTRKMGMRMVRFRHETLALQAPLSIEEERTFLNSVVEHLRLKRMDLIAPAANTALFRAFPDGAASAPYGTIIKDLTLSQDELLAEMDAGCRKNIRRAARAGVEVTTGAQYLRSAYEMTRETMARSGAKLKSWPELEGLFSALGQYGCVFVARHQGSIQASLLCAFSPHSAYTLYGGTAASPVQGAMHLLHWEVMRHFRSLGVARFNFTGVRINPTAGSKQEGILTFKMRFGGTLSQGCTWKYSLAPWKFKAYSMAMQLLSGGDVVDIESRKLQPVRS